jgi:hypothetical protein
MARQQKTTLLSGGLLFLLLLLCETFSGSLALSNHGYSLRKNKQPATRRTEQIKDELTNNSEDIGVSRRVLINPFSVTLSGTSAPFTDLELNDLYKTLEDVILSYIINVQQILNVGYVLLGDIHYAASEDDTTELFLNTGKALFGQASSTYYVPDETTLNMWVAEAVDTMYLSALQQSSFGYVTQVKYSADNATQAADDEDADSTLDEAATSNSNSSNQAGVIIGSIIAVLGAVAVIALLLVRGGRRSVGYVEQQNSNEEDPKDGSSGATGVACAASGEDGAAESDKNPPTGVAATQIHSIVSSSSALSVSTASTENSGPSATQPTTDDVKPGILGAVPMVLDDNRSLDGEESDFTVNTEAGDSLAVKSVVFNQFVEAPPSLLNSIERESFERERQVSIRKDMLTSTWSGQTHLAPLPRNESVLVPSHITASQERLARQERRPQLDDVLIFEQANEESNISDTEPASQVAMMTKDGELV